MSDPTLTEIGAAHGKSVAQVVLRWLTQRNIVSIHKSVRPERMAQNLDVFDFTLTDDEMARIAAMDTGATLLRPPRPRHGQRHRQPAHPRLTTYPRSHPRRSATPFGGSGALSAQGLPGRLARGLPGGLRARTLAGSCSVCLGSMVNSLA